MNDGPGGPASPGGADGSGGLDPRRPAPARQRSGGTIPPGVPSAGEYAGVGLQFAAVIVGAMFAGIWLDRKLGTSPWLLILCVFVGAGAGFYSIYRKLTAAQRRSEGGGPG